MINAIGNVTPINTKNHFYNRFLGPGPIKKEEITEKHRTSFIPIESKGWEHPITAFDLFENPTEEDKEMFDRYWVNKIVSGEKLNSEYIEHLVKKGYSQEQAKYIISFAVNDVPRRVKWAQFNETNGKRASLAVNATIVLGIIKQLLPDSASKIFKTLINLAYGVTRSLRNFFQYSTYNRPDDDVSMNRYQSELYNNKASGWHGILSGLTELKVNSWALTLIELIPEQVKIIVRNILLLPSALWWRVRMLAHVSQDFVTNIFRFLFHLTLSLSGNEKSKKTLDEIKKNKSLSLHYIIQRHYENCGLNDKKEQLQLTSLKKHATIQKICWQGI